MPQAHDFDLSGRLLLDRFRVRERLDRGGMGSVWLADDEKFGLPAVIKIPKVALLEEEGFRARFELEVRSLTKLVHPNIVRVHDFGVVDDVPFMVMQFLAGGSLKQRFETVARKQDPEAVLRWLAPIADALDYMHGQKMIHRDVKPANILFDDANHAHLADFGIAKSLATTVAALTRTGASPGSPLYAPPEAFDGVDLEPTADQFSLALIVYEALTGVQAHGGKSLGEVLGRKLKPLPPIVELAPEVSPTVNGVVMRALQREPAKRFASCGNFAQAFARALREPAANGAARRRNVVRAIIVVLLAAGGVGAWKSWKSRQLTVSPHGSPDADPLDRASNGPPPPTEMAVTIETPRRGGLTAKGKNDQGKLEYVHDQTGLIFVQLDGGTFTMGSPTNEEHRQDCETQHSVTLPPFLIAKYEVTQAIWQQVMGSNPSKYTGDPQRPVEQVSWGDALQFCRKIDAALPTEAQWEFACRAGSTGTYAGNLDDFAWYVANSEKTPHPVGTKQANAWGLYDMHGNVWEWCADWYVDDADAPKNGSITPDQSPMSGSGRVLRGGAVVVGAGGCRSAFRFWFVPSDRSGVIGFRVVLTAASAPH